MIDQVFPACVDHIQSAIDKGNGQDLNIPYLLTECRSGQAFLFINEDKKKITHALILRFENHTDGPVARILVFGGKSGYDWYKEIVNMAQFIKPYADRTIFDGRKGWERKFKDIKVRSVNYELEL
ncbi:MAG: hypothetical protein GY761_03235 [Hyphomicrobiales bacterium]|nr:hypothetical protein [Hyphomicrobiales bacterium]